MSQHCSPLWQVGWHVGAAQVPPAHIEVAPLHGVPQPPQFSGSFVSLTHASLQHWKPNPQPPSHAGEALSGLPPESAFVASFPESAPPSTSPTVVPPHARTVHSASKVNFMDPA